MSEATWLDRLQSGFRKTSERLGDNLTGLFTKAALDEETVEEIEEAYITPVAERLAADRGFTIDDARLDFYGLCARCTAEMRQLA